MSPKRILVVDDHPDSAATLAEVLKLNGHVAKPVVDPREAITAAKDFHPDVAFIDIRMPYIDGLQLAKMFRGEPQLRDVTLVAFTSYNDAKSRAMSFASGFNAHLAKPIAESVLNQVIADIT